MHAIIHVQTNTATIVIYDLMSLKHRLNDDVDWWSLPEDEVEEINKGNVLFLNLGDDGTYKVHIKRDVDESTGSLFLNVPSGKVFIGAEKMSLAEILSLTTQMPFQVSLLLSNLVVTKLNIKSKIQIF
jgi:hypothetical protein